MKELVEYIARAIVDEPDKVVVDEHGTGDRILYHLHVAEEDIGKVIGKGGRIAQSLRTLLKVAAIRADKRAQLEIGD